MTRDLYVYLKDILGSLALIIDYVKDIDEDGFSANIQLQDAVIRRLEIIGEAAKQVPEHFREAHSHIPWREMAGLRDVLIHQYFGVNISRVWKVISGDLVTLKTDLTPLVDQFSNTPKE